MSKAEDRQFKLRLPAELKDWIEEQAKLNRSSQGSEIVRSVRERQERALKEAA